MSFEVTVTPTVYNVEVEVNPSVQPFDVQVITQQDLADLVDEAKQYAEDAEDSADSASASASSASASASASASSANSASASASSASGSANTATTQAGIATTQAGIATTQAGIATTKAQEANQSASDALASEQASAQSASDALQSEQNALASEQASALSEANALASEQSASASASTATAQAGIATTQAGIATTQAGNALTSANNALNSANDAAASAASASAVGTSTLLTGFATGVNTTIAGTDTILQAFQKAQGQINARVSGTGTSGLVSYWSANNTIASTGGLFWDNTNQRLGIGNNSSGAKLDIIQSVDASNSGLIIRSVNSGAFAIGRLNSNDVIFRNSLVDRMVLFNSGNFLIQSGGTFTDAGFRLDVNGTARVQGALSVTTGGASITGLSTIQGTTASDSGQLGSELLTTGTGDASWTGSSFATGYTHVAGSTTTLTSTLAGVVNNFYQITYTVTNRTAGSFTIAFGGFTSSALTATGAVGPQATTTGTLVITPTSSINGTIVLSIRVISVSSASVSFISSSGLTAIELRSNNINSNTFIGNASGRNNTTGFQNVFYGGSAGRNNTTGSNNTLVGLNAGSNNSTGLNNTFIGISSGSNLRIQSNNTFVGGSSGFNLTSGERNVLFGREAGFRIADASNLTQLDNSVFLGVDTRANSNGETNQIVIGHTAIGLGSNTTVIGNSSTTFGRWWGRLLIGTSTDAGFGLDVAGTSRIQATADTIPLTISGYSVTGSNAQSALSITGTWNTTGAPTALLVNITNTASNVNSLLMDLQVGGSSLFRFGRNGILSFNTNSVLSIYGQNNGSPITTANAGFAFRSSLLNTAVGPDFVFINGQGARDITSGSGIYLSIQPQSFSPTSGTATFTTLQVTQTINQTGGANGITRGLFVNPTLTSASDWRSIEWSNNTGRGLWGTGTANNALAGATHIGSASNANASAILELTSTTRGLLLPRMTSAERDAIASPVAGLIVYNTTANQISFYNGTAWTNL
jgi:hypothetical protein